MEILNPDLVCEDCGNKWTYEGEWVMDNYACPDDEGYCLNCCMCAEHATDGGAGPFYYPKPE